MPAASRSTTATSPPRSTRSPASRAPSRRPAPATAASRSRSRGASANTDVPPSRSSTARGTCVATVRETAKGGGPLASWPAGGTVAVSTLTAPATRSRSAAPIRAPTSTRSRSSPTPASPARSPRRRRARPGILPPGATGTVNALGRRDTLDDTGFQVTFGAGLGRASTQPSLVARTSPARRASSARPPRAARREPGLHRHRHGQPRPGRGDGARVHDPAAHAVRAHRQRDGRRRRHAHLHVGAERPRRHAAGTALVNNNKTDGPLFRQFGTAATSAPTDTLLSPSPGENDVDDEPDPRVPGHGADPGHNTNAAPARARPRRPRRRSCPPAIRDCFSEFLPTADWVGSRRPDAELPAHRARRASGRRRHRQRRRQARRSRPAPGRSASPRTAPPATLRGGSHADGHLGRGGHRRGADRRPRGQDQPLDRRRRRSRGAGGGDAERRVGDRDAADVAHDKARIKVEAVGNVFFDVSDADLAIQACAGRRRQPTRRSSTATPSLGTVRQGDSTRTRPAPP